MALIRARGLAPVVKMRIHLSHRSSAPPPSSPGSIQGSHRPAVYPARGVHLEQARTAYHTACKIEYPTVHRSDAFAKISYCSIQSNTEICAPDVSRSLQSLLIVSTAQLVELAADEFVAV